MKMKEENKDGKKKKAFVETDLLLREMITKELKDKLSKKIDSDDPQIINAIKTLLSESDDEKS
jgi:hypothetical protein